MAFLQMQDENDFSTSGRGKNNLMKYQQAYGAAPVHQHRQPDDADADGNDRHRSIKDPMSVVPLNIARVSMQMQGSLLLGNLQGTQLSLLQVEQQLSRGQQLNLPSDNPTAAVDHQPQAADRQQQKLFHQPQLRQRHSQPGRLHARLAFRSDHAGRRASPARRSAPACRPTSAPPKPRSSTRC